MDASEDESPRSALVSIKLPPVPAYPAPLPPSLSEAPVWDGPEPDSDSDDEYSSSETGDYEQIEHEPLTEEQARETLNDVKQVIGKEGRVVYAYESTLPPLPAPLIAPDEDFEVGYDPFRSMPVEGVSAAEEPLPKATHVELPADTDFAPLATLQAYFRAQLVRGWYSKRLTMIFHRDKVAAEILSTEQTYVHNLKVLTGIFMPPLQMSMNSANPIITKEEYDKLFPRLDIIQGLNGQLLEQLKERMQNWSNRTCLADIFTKMAAFFKMYTEYCSKYEEAVRVYRELLKKRREFVEYLKRLEGLPDLQSLDLPSFLILPCQRIPRYLMLVSELNKWTWTDHPDKQNLEQAVSKWQEVANHVNNSMDEAARMNELLSIERKFNNQLNLVVPHRKFIKQGEIHKITSRIVVTPTYFLFTDILVYGYPTADGDEVHYKGTILLSTAWVRNLEDTEDLKNGFQLVTPEKAYTFYLDTAKEKRKWVVAIESCINRLVAIDPMLVTQRATKVKRSTRVGQKLWNLFTKDLDSLFASEDDVIKDSVSSVNQSLAETRNTLSGRSFIPVRGSLEEDWAMTPDPKRNSKSYHDKESSTSHGSSSSSNHSKTPSSTSSKTSSSAPNGTNSKDSVSVNINSSNIDNSAGVNSGKGAKNSKVNPAPQITLIEPELLPSFDGLESKPIIRQGLTRDEDPLEPALVSLETAIDHRSPTESRRNASSQSPPTTHTRSTRSKLIGNDKQYTQLQNDHAIYGRLSPDAAQPESRGCCSSCSIM